MTFTITPIQIQISAFIIGVVTAVAAGALFTMSQQQDDELLIFKPATKAQEYELVRKEIEEYGAVGAYERFGIRHANTSFDIVHTRAHIFGEELYKHEGVQGVAVCDANFSFGCYHSFFGFALMEHGVSIMSELDQACIDVHGFRGLGCQHGIGHGVLAELGSDQLLEALELCSELQWKGPIGGCTSGVLMEFSFETMRQDGHIRTVENDDYHYPCNDLPEKFQQACYFEMPPWWLAVVDIEKRSNPDSEVYVRVSALCDEVPDSTNRIACYRGLGNVVIDRAKGDKISEIKEMCAYAPTADGNSYCLQGAAWRMAYEPGFEDFWYLICSDEVGEQYEQCLASKDFI